MARKSRVKTDEIIANPKQEAFRTAIYVRLSVENSGKSEEVDAIGNQIEICKSYVAERPYLHLVDVYKDNGTSGTVFSRPNFNRLMSDIKCGKINSIVVCDLSRFGRDYIETGTYLERIFPEIGLRFISIRENYDNFEVDQTNESLMIPFQNMINSLYAKDISRKVSSALRTQMENGTFKNRNLAYGYMWDNERNKVIIDEEVAEYVRLMFKWKIEGISNYQIVKRLNELNAPTPEYRKSQNGVRNAKDIEMLRKVKWGKSTLFNILHNEFYTGSTCLAKSESRLYKGMKKQKNDKSKWLVFENTHKAIISLEDFKKVQEIMSISAETLKQKKEESKSVRSTLIDLFDKKVFCADCGKRMYFRRHKLDYSGCKVEKNIWYAVYICSSNNSRLDVKCTPHNIQQKHFEEKILSAIQMQTKVAIDYEKLIDLLQRTKGNKSVRDKLNSDVSSLTLKLNAVKKRQMRLYGDYKDDILSEEEYLFAKASYDNEYESLNVKLEESILRRNEFNHAISPDNKWIVLMKSVSEITQLNQKIVDEIVERVLVHEDKSLEIIMKCSDIFALTETFIEEIEKAERKLNKLEKMEQEAKETEGEHE